MNWFLRVQAAPGDLVALSDAKAHARVTSDAEDSAIESYIKAASAAIDGPYGMAGRCFGAQVWDFYADRFAQRFLIPVPGATSITSFTYFDENDAEQTLTAADYFYVVPRDDGIALQVKDGLVLPIANRREDAIRVRVSAPENIPLHIKHAVLLTVANWFDSREMGDVPIAARQLIDIERQGWAGA